MKLSTIKASREGLQGAPVAHALQRLALPAVPSRPTLRPFQMDAKGYLVRQALELNLGGMLAMEMRLGKTVVTVDFFSSELPKDVNVVVCPYPVIGTWEKELRNFGIEDFQSVTGTRSKRIEKLHLDKRWFIINYEMVERINIFSYHFDNLICDESVKLANPQSKITGYTLKHRTFPKRNYLLAGKACPRNLKQLITQILIIKGTCLGKRNYWDVRNTFFDNVGFDYVPKAGTTALLNEEFHNTCFVLSRKEAGLPDEKIYSVRNVQMGEQQKKDYLTVLEKFGVEDVETDYHIGQRILLHKIAGGWDVVNGAPYKKGKLAELLYLLEGDLKDEPLIIWCAFVHEVELISFTLLTKGLRNKRITGEVKNREEIREEFQAGKLNIVVATIKALAKGTDWSKADTAVIYSNEDSFDLRSQLEDRIYNINKAHPLLIIDLVTVGTIDQHIYDALQEDHVDEYLMSSKIMKNLKRDALCLA